MDQDSEMTAAPDNLNDDAAAADHYEQMQQGIDSLAQQFMDGGPSPRYVRAASEFCTDLAKQLMELCTALEGGQVNEPGDEAGHTQPVNHAVNHAATAPVVASTLEYASILPDDIVSEVYKEAYNALWMTALNVPAIFFERFDDEYDCRHKMEELFRNKALVEGDKIQATFRLGADGEYVKRYAVVVEVGKEKGPWKWAPHIAMLATEYAEPGTATTQCSTPDEVIKALMKHFGHSITTVKGYAGVRVERDDESLGTIRDLRAVYGFWSTMVNQWTQKKKMVWKNTFINPETGEFYHKEGSVKKKTKKT